jgi:hypothetical protein
LHVGSLASKRAGPRTLRYAIGGLDQLSRRMRARASTESVKRISGAQRRARDRRLAPPPATRLQFRLSGPRWPRWLTVDEHAIPVFSGGLPVTDPELAPPVRSEAYRTVIRDAYLIAGRQLPVLLDGRWAMRLRDAQQIPPAQRHVGELDRELAELAHRTGQPLATLTRVRAEVRAGILAHLRAAEARQARAQTQAFHEQLAQALNPDHQPPRASQAP